MLKKLIIAASLVAASVAGYWAYDASQYEWAQIVKKGVCLDFDTTCPILVRTSKGDQWHNFDKLTYNMFGNIHSLEVKVK